MVKGFWIFFCLSAGVMGCTPYQGLADRYDTMKENNEVLEIRLTNFEERLTLVEQEVGILRSHGALPEGARWVDPAPSLSKVGASGAAGYHPSGNASAHASGGTSSPLLSQSPGPVPSPTPSPLSSPLPSSLSSPALASSAPAAQVSAPSTPKDQSGLDSGPARLPQGASTSAIDQFIGQYGAAEQEVILAKGGGTSQPAPRPMPSLLPPQGQGMGQGRPAVAPAPSTRASSPAPRAVASAPVSSGSLKGLPAGFRTGVRAYDEALAMYYRHEYSRSSQAFVSFVEGNKGHKLVPNALYWQGESAYSQGDYLGAILSFKSITSQFPKHAKAADALLKIGMSYERLKDSDNARFYWQVLLDDFPKSSAARAARGKMPR